MNSPCLIALDWGTSNLRARLLDPAGDVLATRNTAAGVLAITQHRFAEALLVLCGDWLSAYPRCACIASGMVGSRQGWIEAPYLACPAGLAAAAAQLAQVGFGDGDRHTLHIVPGLRCVGRDDQVDVMRGEETQLWGADLPAGTCCVLPGTHSKWAWMGEDEQVLGFQTHMTGELYALLTQHSILGRLMDLSAPAPPSAPAAFDDGVRLGLQQHAHLLHTLFATRTAGLMGQRTPAELPHFLSGLLIGAEVASARSSRLQDVPAPDAVTLLGEGALCDRYARALALAGLTVRHAPVDATTRGQWRVAVAAGLALAAR